MIYIKYVRIVMYVCIFYVMYETVTSVVYFHRINNTYVTYNHTLEHLHDNNEHNVFIMHNTSRLRELIRKYLGKSFKHEYVLYLPQKMGS